VKDEALPILQKRAEATGVDVTFRADGHVIYVDYDPLGIEFPVIGTIWCGSTMRAMPKPRLTTMRWRRKSPIGKASSFACAIATGSGSTITPPFQESFK
jgi:hypothetical protein